MKLLDFIAWCWLHGYVDHNVPAEPPLMKMAIWKGGRYCELLYSPEGDGKIIKCYLSKNHLMITDVSIDELVEAFFPDK